MFKHLINLLFMAVDNGRSREVIGFYGMSLRKINIKPETIAQIEAKGYMPPLDTFLTSGGGGGTIRKNGVYIGGSGQGGGNLLMETEQFVSAGGGSGSMDIGYMIRPVGWLRFYPFFGVGGAGNGIIATELSDDEPSQPIMTDDTITTSQIEFLSALVGVGFEVKIGGRVGLTLGMRLGWWQPLLTSKQAANKGRPYVMPIVGFQFSAGRGDG